VSLQTRFSGKAWVLPDDVDTDQIVPGKYLAKITEEELGPHVLEGYDQSFPQKVNEGDVIVAGQNFGCGSSREHAPIAIKGAGVPVVVAESFARIFYRNAFNVGLPALEVPDISSHVDEGDEVSVDLESGEVTNETTGETFNAEPLSDKALELIEAGGLVNLTRQKLEQRES
jgi:3-isopropylmalate/(R)-2-methylmalate dehydratase small subunit